MAGRVEGRILTVPNLITALRLVCLPVFVLLLAAPDHSRWPQAAYLLAAMGISDSVDGFVARRFDQVSALGKILDPLADRLLVGVAAISTIVVGAIPLGVAIAILVREAIVSGATVGLALAGARRIDVQRLGKAAALGLMVSFPLFLVGHSHLWWHHWAEAAAWVAALIGLACGWISVVTYVPIARRALREGRGSGPDGRGRAMATQ